MFDKITVIGCGLIGSSILRALEKKDIKEVADALGLTPSKIAKSIEKHLHTS